MTYRDIVLIRSGGDISSGIIERLYKCGFKVVVLETGNPSSIRREVSFSEAVYRKKMTINGITSVLADGIEEMEKILENNEMSHSCKAKPAKPRTPQRFKSGSAGTKTGTGSR